MIINIKNISTLTTLISGKQVKEQILIIEFFSKKLTMLKIRLLIFTLENQKDSLRQLTSLIVVMQKEIELL